MEDVRDMNTCARVFPPIEVQVRHEWQGKHVGAQELRLVRSTGTYAGEARSRAPPLAGTREKNRWNVLAAAPLLPLFALHKAS